MDDLGANSSDDEASSDDSMIGWSSPKAKAVKSYAKKARDRQSSSDSDSVGEL